jgi:hypothetical protein
MTGADGGVMLAFAVPIRTGSKNSSATNTVLLLFIQYPCLYNTQERLLTVSFFPSCVNNIFAQKIFLRGAAFWGYLYGGLLCRRNTAWRTAWPPLHFQNCFEFRRAQ